MAPLKRSQTYRDRLSQIFGSIRATGNLSQLDLFPTSSTVSGSSLRSHDTAQSMGRTPEQCAEPVPPTTNELDARSRARLVRQARKLSRVFGEIPSLDSEPPAGDSLQRSKSPNSLTVSERSERGHRARSRHTSTRRTTAKDIDSSTIRSRSIRSFSDDNLSIISLVPPLSTDAKLAKLNRLLGDGVPSELVFPSKADVRTRKKTRRRKSLDVNTFMTPSSSPQTLKRSRSMVTRKAHHARESADFHQRYSQNFGSEGVFTERQHALNVKRARKMIQMFGDQPPKEFILDAASHSIVPMPSTRSTPPLSPLSPTLSLTSLRSLSTIATSKSLPHQEDQLLEISRESRRTSPSVLDSLRHNETPVSHPSDFQERRRRVAKLSRFFGVDYHDINSSPIPAHDLVPPFFSDTTSAAVQVEVKLGGRRLWRFMDSDQDIDPDMNLVLDKLRELRAA